MRLVVIESPYAGDIEANINYARLAMRDSIMRGEARVMFSSLAPSELFKDKPGELYSFKDKGDRDICLIPEVTAVAREYYMNDCQHLKKPVRIYYIERCYRYERPQRGRYREFIQFGIECFGPVEKQDNTKDILAECFKALNIPVEFDPLVKRGLDYYLEDGFEARINSLGAQKQVAGGGRYDCGQGFAIGVDRVALAVMDQKNSASPFPASSSNVE
jgi:histidyl-tRNA synthetase